MNQEKYATVIFRNKWTSLDLELQKETFTEEPPGIIGILETLRRNGLAMGRGAFGMGPNEGWNPDHKDILIPISW